MTTRKKAFVPHFCKVIGALPIAYVLCFSLNNFQV
jgi:hypothetical protein